MAASNWLVFAGWKLVMGTTDGGDMGSATFRMRLATNTYTPNLVTDICASAGFLFLSAADGHTSAASAMSLANNEWSSVSAGEFKFDFDDEVFTASVATSAMFAVVYHDATNKLVCYCALETGGGTADVVFTQLTVANNASGVFTLNGGTTA